VPRRKVFETKINLPITDAQLARIEAVLSKATGEVRVAFIRTAIKRELERREKVQKKPGAAVMSDLPAPRRYRARVAKARDGST
jgi:hypothetical protein